MYKHLLLHTTLSPEGLFHSTMPPTSIFCYSLPLGLSPAEQPLCDSSGAAAPSRRGSGGPAAILGEAPTGTAGRGPEPRWRPANAPPGQRPPRRAAPRLAPPRMRPGAPRQWLSRCRKRRGSGPAGRRWQRAGSGGAAGREPPPPGAAARAEGSGPPAAALPLPASPLEEGEGTGGAPGGLGELR